MHSSIRLIATDEAGYGPKLGPLVIAATDYRLSRQSEDNRFASIGRLGTSYRLGDAIVRVDDSKAIYKPKSLTKKDADPLANLHATVSVANAWCQHAAKQFDHWFKTIASQDWASIQAAPWLREISTKPFLADDAVQHVADVWSSEGDLLEQVLCRVIPAATFNQICQAGKNKADLLSESTLGLVREILRESAGGSDTFVFCDRHGGRRYYAGVLQHVFDGATVEVVSESKQKSVYRMNHRGQVIQFQFTVKGDSFAPVALSSIYAKYIRERMMESFNRYFASRHEGVTALPPTAGYPVDADRFLIDVAPIIQQEKISTNELIRAR